MQRNRVYKKFESYTSPNNWVMSMKSQGRPKIKFEESNFRKMVFHNTETVENTWLHNYSTAPRAVGSLRRYVAGWSAISRWRWICTVRSVKPEAAIAMPWRSDEWVYSKWCTEDIEKQGSHGRLSSTISKAMKQDHYRLLATTRQ